MNVISAWCQAIVEDAVFWSESPEVCKAYLTMLGKSDFEGIYRGSTSQFLRDSGNPSWLLDKTARIKKPEDRKKHDELIERGRSILKRLEEIGRIEQVGAAQWFLPHQGLLQQQVRDLMRKDQSRRYQKAYRDKKKATEIKPA